MDLLEFFSFGWLKWPGSGLDAFFDLTGASFWIAVICSLMGAYALSQRTADSGAFNFPVNLLALFFGAALANWLGKDVPLPLDQAVLVPAILSLTGISLVGLTILWVVKRA
jgi:hypothetical protein